MILFNQIHPVLQVNPSNGVDLFLFSSLPGVHLLSDTLHNQTSTLDTFLAHFTHCLNVYRGVLAIIDQAWDLLQETELGPRPALTRTATRSNESSNASALLSVVIPWPASMASWRWAQVSHRVHHCKIAGWVGEVVGGTAGGEDGKCDETC